jgi:Ca-activated chloride channel family protein
VYTIGVGREGIDFNPVVLQKISKETGGKYFVGDSVQRIEEIYSTINRLEKSEIKADRYIKRSYYFQYILLLGLIGLIAYFYLRNRE